MKCWVLEGLLAISMLQEIAATEASALSVTKNHLCRLQEINTNLKIMD